MLQPRNRAAPSGIATAESQAAADARKACTELIAKNLVLVEPEIRPRQGGPGRVVGDPRRLVAGTDVGKIALDAGLRDLGCGHAGTAQGVEPAQLIARNSAKGLVRKVAAEIHLTDAAGPEIGAGGHGPAAGADQSAGALRGRELSLELIVLPIDVE